MILGMGIISLGGLSLRTSRQILVWRDSETLWADVISREPASIAYQNLGMALAERGNISGAMSYFREALRLDPDDPEVHNDMGAVLLAAGKADEASLHFRQALRHKQNLPNSHYGLGYTLSLKGRVQEAIEEYQTALRLKPDYEAAQRELKKGLALLGKSQSEPRRH